MAIDVETLAAARTYTDDSLKGVGSVQGKNCTIQEITKEGTTNTVVFGWTDDEGNVSTSEMIVEDGKDGADGVDGKDGETGPKGDPGEKGETGETGATGASAYEVALANGFEGSEEDWLKSLTPTNIVTVSNSPFESHAGNFKINEISGKCEQLTTTGAQLFDMSNAVGGTISGITAVINPNGTYTLSGIPEEEYPNIWLAGYYSNTSSVFKLASGTYTLIDAIFYSNDGITVKTFRNTFTIESETPITAVRITALTVGQTYNNITFYPMLNAGATALPWEPYTGGMPAPNPDYPQEIKKTVVSEIKTHGKNLLNNVAVSQTVNGVTFTVNDDKSVVVNGIASEHTACQLKWDALLAAGEYIMSGCPRNGGASRYSLNIRGITNDFGAGVTFSLSETKSVIVQIVMAAGTVCDNLVFYPMIRKADVEDDTYEPYIESVITLSEPIELYGIGDVQDTIEDCKVVRRFAEVVLNGNEEWIVFATAQSGKYRNSFNGLKDIIQVPEDITRIANIYCTHYIPVSCNSAGTYGCNQGISVETSTSNMYIYDEVYNTSDVSLWKSRLQSNPITVVYELATPVIEDLPIADQSALNSLKTFDNLTYVEFDSEVKPTFSGETALTTEGSHILESLAKSNALTLEYLDAATYICDNLP